MTSVINIAWHRLRFDVSQLSNWRWKKKTILQPMSGHCLAGTVTGLFGPSGSGKTSLLNILSGSSTPSSGHIYLGTHLEASPVSYYIRQHVHESIVGELTVQQILRYAFAFKNGNSTEIENHIEKTMNALILPVDLLNRRFAQCSGGEQKRVAIAQELMHSRSSPAFLFLDEPTTGLDSVSAFEVISCLHQLTKTFPMMTIIASIHSPNCETLNLFDKVYVLSKGGHAIYFGPPNQIKDNLSDTITFTENIPPIEVLLKEACQGNVSANVLKLANETKLKETFQIESHQSKLVKQPFGFICTRKKFCVSDFSTSLFRQFRITFLAQLSTVLFMPFIFFFSIILLNNVIAIRGTKRSKCSLHINTNSNCTVEDPLQLNDPEQQNISYILLVLTFTSLLIITTTTIMYTKHLKIFQREHRNYWYSVGANFWSSDIVFFLELNLNVLIVSVLSYFISGQHLDDEQFNFNRFVLYTFFVWLMCLYYQATGQLIGSLLMNYQLFAVITTILIYSIFTLFNGLFVRLHRTADVFFEEVANSIAMLYAIRGIHYAIFVFDRCKEEGQFSEVAIDFHIEVDKLDMYVLRVLINVLVVKTLTLLVLFIKFNDWRRKEANENVDIDEVLLESETTFTVNCNFKSLVSAEATPLHSKIAIAWQNLSLLSDNSVYDFGSNKSQSNQPILCNLNGHFCFGTLNALMGTSGAGKTSLLRVLNGQHKTRLSDETEIYLSKLTTIKTCFIAQEISDHLMKGLTGKQLVMYASKMKNVFPLVDHDDIANKWLQELDILGTADTPVERCSGGERKRLAVALELTSLDMPNLVFFDEPTSGLDSYSAEVVISTLKKIANSHPLTIITSIHQPTAEILYQFDQLYILARGGVCIYNATPSDLQDYVNQVPELFNSASKSTSPIELLIRQSCASWPNELTFKLNHLTPQLDKNTKLTKETYLSLSGVVANRTRFTLHSVLQLSNRYLQYIRTYLWKEWIVYIFICLMLAVSLRLLFSPQMIYYSSCVNLEQDDLSSCQKSPEKVLQKLMLRDNFTFIYYSFVVFLSMPILYSAVSLYQELAVMESEHRNGWYSAGSYLLMRSLFEVIPVALSNVFFVLIMNIYEPVVTSSVYFSFWLILTLSHLSYSALGQCITLISGNNFNLAVIIIGVFNIFFMLIGSVYVPLSQMHYIYRILSLFSTPRFAFNLPILLQYGFGRCQGKEVSLALYMIELEDADYLPNFGMLLMNVIFYRLLSLYLLIRRVNPLENRKKRVDRIVQHQTEMAKGYFI